jgi:type I restriction enzyme R subunit
MTNGLWGVQVEAITNLEKSFCEAKPRALIQMATGSGKTFTSVSFVYRLIKFAKAKRVLFLVDRNNLGEQTLKEFMQYITPDDGRKFTELYNVQHMTSNTLDPVCRVCITTIQRLFSMLKGEKDFEETREEFSSFETREEGPPKEVEYNPAIPIEDFDFIITDECHRSIYNLWSQVLEYFDCFLIGLTATPSKQTLGFFNQNLVMEYTHERAVADGVNVGFEVYNIETEITQKGSVVQAGYQIQKMDKMTRAKRWELLDEDFSYTATQLDRSVTTPSQIRTILRTYRDKLFTEIFPGRTEVPKTLIFAKSDAHAEEIVQIAREEFGKGNDFCKKITYNTVGENPKNLIASFRNSYNPRIAVTVDMISTGTDIKPLECLIFMRDVKSRGYFEQMIGRGTRVIDSNDFKAVTPDADAKTHFVAVDAVGVFETAKTDLKPLEKKKSVPFHKLLENVSQGIQDAETLSSLAGRLAKLDREVNVGERKELEQLAEGKPLKEIVNRLLDAVDPDKRIEKAKEVFATGEPTETQVEDATKTLAKEACKPFNEPTLRKRLIAIKAKHEQVIDVVSVDTLRQAGFDGEAPAQMVVNNFKLFIAENRDELTAIQIFYEQPYGSRHLTYEQIKELAEAIEKPPYNLTPEHIWNAYRILEGSRVHGAGSQKLLTNLVSLLRYAIGETDILEPYSEVIDRRYAGWLDHQKVLGREFTPDQREWLDMIKDHIATSLQIEMNDFENTPFHDKGGAVKIYQLFGKDLDAILSDLNERLAA